MNLSDKAQRARALLDDQVLNEILGRLETGAIEALLRLDQPGDHEDKQRLNAINKANLAREIRSELQSIVDHDLAARNTRSAPV